MLLNQRAATGQADLRRGLRYASPHRRAHAGFRPPIIRPLPFDSRGFFFKERLYCFRLREAFVSPNPISLYAFSSMEDRVWQLRFTNGFGAGLG